MAGVPAGASAGRLYVDIIAEAARLDADMRRLKSIVNANSGDMMRSAKQVNDALRNVGRGGGAGMAEYSREVARLKAQLEPTWAAMQRYREQVTLLRKAHAQEAISLSQYREQIRAAKEEYQSAAGGMVKSGGAVVASTGAQRAGMQQLSYQIGDMATMFSMGARPMQIFASQSGQVIQAISLMQGGASRFSTFMMGPWGMAVTAGTLIMVPLIASLFDTGKSAEEANKAINDLAQQFDFAAMSAEQLRKVNELLAESNAKVERTALGAATATRNQAQANLDNAKATLIAAKAEYERIAAFTSDPTFAEGSVAYGGYLEKAGATPNKIAELEKAIAGFTMQTRGAQYEMDTLTAGMTKQELYAEKLRTAVLAMGEAYKRTGNESFRLQGLAFQEKLTALDNQGGGGGSSSNRRASGLSAEAKAASEAQREYERLVETSAQYAADLQKQADRFGMTALEIQRMEVAARAAEAPTTELMLAIVKAGNALEAKQIAKAADDFEQMIKALRDENSLLGLVGPARERAALALEKDAKMAEWAAQGLGDLEDRWREYLALRTEGIDERGALDEDAAAAERLNEQLTRLVDLLGQIGGIGSVFGGLLSIAGGNFNINGGAFGSLASMFLRMETGQTEFDEKSGERVAILLGDKLQEIFGRKGLFGETLQENLQAAGLGMSASYAVFGRQDAASQFASAAGGMLGEVAGKELLGFLGNFAGPVGSIVGGLLGGLIGGVFAGIPKGSITLNGSAITGTMGKGDQLGAATESANSILGSLKQIAEALGGTLGSVSGVSIGMRGDEWRVDPLGRGQTKAPGVINFGTDAEAAALYAMKLLIERGVIGGIRASTQNILKAGDDLQAQIDKALAFEQVFKDLEEASSPFAAEMAALGERMEYLTGVFAEAKATTEEYAKLQEWLTLQQQKLIEQAGATYRANFNSDAENMAYARKTISDTLTPLGFGDVNTVEKYKALVAATDALANPELYGALMELADEFAVLKDAADDAAKAAKDAAELEKALAVQRMQLQAQILEAQGRTAEALAMQRKMELEVADESLRPLMKELFKAQDIAAARDVLAQAYERESGELQQTVDRLKSLGDSLRDVRAEIYGAEAGSNSYAARLAELRRVGQMASLGDQDAMGNLGGVIRDFLPAARSQARTLADYQMSQALAARYADSAISAADQGILLAQQQLDEMKAQVEALGVVAEEVVSVEDAIERLIALQGGGGSGGATSGGGQAEVREGLDRLRDVFDLLRGEFNTRWERIEAAQVQGTLGLNSISRFFKLADKNGKLRVSIAEDETA